MNATMDYPIDWHDPRRLISCPVCGSGCGKTAVLTTPNIADPQRRPLVTFLRCDACSSLFCEDRVPFEYELGLSSWAGEYYLEQGAGLDSMIDPGCICRRSRSEPCSRSAAVSASPWILLGSSGAGSSEGWILRRLQPKDGECWGSTSAPPI